MTTVAHGPARTEPRRPPFTQPRPADCPPWCDYTGTHPLHDEGPDRFHECELFAALLHSADPIAGGTPRVVTKVTVERYDFHGQVPGTPRLLLEVAGQLDNLRVAPTRAQALALRDALSAALDLPIWPASATPRAA